MILVRCKDGTEVEMSPDEVLKLRMGQNLDPWPVNMLARALEEQLVVEVERLKSLGWSKETIEGELCSLLDCILATSEGEGGPFGPKERR